MAVREARLTVRQRLRPLRLALVVDPRDRTSLRRAVEISTTQWGGAHNVLVPAFRRRPSWWIEPFEQPSAREIVHAFLDAVDPDYVVDCTQGRASDALVSRELPVRTLQSDPTSDREHAGLSTLHVYEYLHREVFRFVRTAGPEVVIPWAPEPHSDFAAVCFGVFPARGGLASVGRVFQQAFQAERVRVTAHSLPQLLNTTTSRFIDPLTVSMESLAIQRPAYFGELQLFVLDPRESIDLIDFWNLRAVVGKPLPVPIDWLDELAQPLAEIGRNGGGPIGDVLVSAGRRVPDSAVTELVESLRSAGRHVSTDPNQVNWHSRVGMRPEIAEIDARTDRTRLETISGRVEVSLLSPTFAAPARQVRGSWANVINLEPDSGSEEAAVFPPALGRVDDLLSAWSPTNIQARREGLVALVSHEEKANFRPPTGVDLASKVAGDSGLDPALSDPGTIAREMSRRLGGLLGVSLLRDRGLIDLLNKATGRQTRRQSISRQEMLQVLSSRHAGDRQRALQHLDRLLEHRVIEAGVLLKCTNCTQINWYSPDELALSLQCERCLERFDFPQANPPRPDDWAYRPLGGFRVPDYARGSYAVLLSLRLLAGLTPDAVTWAPSMTLGQDLEFDFAIWRADRARISATPDLRLLIGECKTNRSFEVVDLERARALQIAFPDAIIVFATLKDELDDMERDLIRAIARPESTRLKPSRPDVIVLTALELLSQQRPVNRVWRDAGGRAAEIAPRHLPAHQPEVDAIADLSQQIHLELESFGDWLLAS